MSHHSNRFDPIGVADAAAENALLRASLEEAQRRIAELEQGAEVDGLTGVANALRFQRGLERVVSSASRHGTQAAVLHIDILGLTALNDRHGRFGGDSALRHVATLLGGLIRSTDLLARVGGDRFALILDHLDQDSAIDTAERLARCIGAEPADLGSSRVPVRVAIAATGILAGDTVEDVLARAERNLAFAKAEA